MGSDILAGVLATEMHESDSLVALVDLGTNGEIAIGNRERILCASTAAGPAFEGGGISMGMQATTGAITAVSVEKGGLRCRVQGDVPARGICGSGLVDAIAAGLDLGIIEPSGRLSSDSNPFEISPGVSLTQRDVRQLQLAKGATAAGIRILLERWNAEPRDLSRLHLAGAFGNYVDPASARRVGLIDLPGRDGGARWQHRAARCQARAVRRRARRRWSSLPSARGSITFPWPRTRSSRRSSSSRWPFPPGGARERMGSSR